MTLCSVGEFLQITAAFVFRGAHVRIILLVVYGVLRTSRVSNVLALNATCEAQRM